MRASRVTAACLAACLVAVLAAGSVPHRLTDAEFWALSADLSEPSGTFRSDNLMSNEQWIDRVLGELTRTVRPGGVYMGVGPEQNFTYIAALKPAMAFIVDVRRGNLQLHLLYKALFELSANRNEFVSRLFSRRQVEGIAPDWSASSMFTAYKTVAPSEELYAANLKAIKDHLVVRHGFPLTIDDVQGVEYVYRTFFKFGPDLQYSSSGFGGSAQPTYADLMAATDASGRQLGFLASDGAFAVVKDLESRNLIVPVVGNFGGPKAIRAVGEYVASKGATVTAFYLSNVEQYLRQDDLWQPFCANLTALPVDETSRFIHALRGRGAPGVGLINDLGSMQEEIASCPVS
jgi:hypothetical protein